MSEGTIAPEQFTINGQEYSPEEASQLIELGNKYRETEKNLNTSLDKLMPEYTKATQRAARADQLEQERETYKKRVEEYEAKEKQTQVSPDRQKIIQAARENGLADQDWLKEQGYVRKDDLEAFFTQKDQQTRQTNTILEECKKNEEAIDGSDGRPPFDTNAVLAYMSVYGNQLGLKNTTEAYTKMNEKAISKWQETQIAKSERPGLTTLKPGGKKEYTEPKIETDSDFKKAWDEMFPNS